jgi:predicted acyl esterase
MKVSHLHPVQQRLVAHCSQQQSSDTRDPRAIHLQRARPHQCVSTSPADTVILISQRSDSKTATDYTWCTLGCSACSCDVRGSATSPGRLDLMLPASDGEAPNSGCLPVAVMVGEDAR